VVCTEWNEFRHLDLPRLRQAMRTPNVVDGRNIYDAGEMRQAGFHYRGVGRGYNGALEASRTAAGPVEKRR
jgi:UDPglucose 6-dehydrogenase